MTALPDLAAIEAMDAADPLRAFRDRFVLPQGVIYLDGNSLGAAAPAVFARAAEGSDRGMGARPHPQLEHRWLVRPAGRARRPYRPADRRRSRPDGG